MSNLRCRKSRPPNQSHQRINTPALSSPVPLTTPSRGCPTCKPKSTQTQPSVDLNATSLAVGEPCGVYTLSCAHGLRCAPPEDEPRPLRALLEGRGVCINASNISLTDNSHTVDPAPTEDPDEAPCRKLLTTLITGLDAHLFNSNQDIYMPNCDKRGFFRKKQCWSSRGKQRGKCWCVDRNGMPVSSNTKQRGGLSC
ncbi:insulin-like growth factor-binding protein 5 isoform X1 [Micropterus salmoides]|uniref:insulin-like growth factor-binding protein 5 isoform X1 n=1 Tax=Micropterus salmoides TaxID=27706 RepID=UPI0018EAE300|nr:insulin-like growth factor-binding protein 5 isoform X1 [Micropterus salmoides]